jgi:TM2 domain-containing membrane protein YozV
VKLNNSDKFWAAFLLALFLGIFGAHRFYLKSPKRVLMLCTFGGFGVWVLIDIITILLGKFNDETGQIIVNPKPAVSWAIFVVVGIVGIANDDQKKTSDGSVPKSISSQAASNPSEKAREPYCGVYLSTTGQFRGSLALYSGGSCEIKFGNGGSTRTGFWTVEGDKIRVQVRDAGDTWFQIDSPRRLSIHKGGIDANYDRI